MNRTIIGCTDPAWSNVAQTSIVCKVTTREAGGPFLFNAMESDPEPHGKQLWQDLIAGRYGPIAPYVAPITMQKPGKGPNVIA